MCPRPHGQPVAGPSCRQVLHSVPTGPRGAGCEQQGQSGSRERQICLCSGQTPDAFVSIAEWFPGLPPVPQDGHACP